jgi:type I site-specific restriction endonuclease
MEERKYISPKEILKYKGLSEDDTRVKLFDPQLKASGWSEENIRCDFPITRGKVLRNVTKLFETEM